MSVARDQPSTSRRAKDVAERVSAAAGNDRPWVFLYGTDEGGVASAQPAGQHPGVTSQFLADGLHAATCPGCRFCRPGDLTLP